MQRYIKVLCCGGKHAHQRKYHKVFAICFIMSWSFIITTLHIWKQLFLKCSWKPTILLIRQKSMIHLARQWIIHCYYFSINLNGFFIVAQINKKYFTVAYLLYLVCILHCFFLIHNNVTILFSCLTKRCIYNSRHGECDKFDSIITLFFQLIIKTTHS